MRRLADWQGIFLGAAILTVGLGMLLAGSGQAQADVRVALVIGNSDYKNVARLENPDRDATAIADVFKRLGFDTTLVLDQDRQALEKSLRAFTARARGAEIAAVYYAGHGMEADGENYLIPTDATLRTDDDIDYELIPLDLVLRAVSGAKQLRLVILDACRNNPFAAKMANAGGTRAIGRGFVRVEPANNTLVAYAAKDGTVAEDGNGEHSPFAGALLKHLAEPGLAVNFVFGKVRDDVLAATDSRQEPFVYGSLGGQAVYLVPPLPPAPAPPAPTSMTSQVDPKALDLAYWEAIKDSTDPGDYAAYLKQFPSGTFAGLAQVRQARLQASVSAADAKGPAQVAALTPEVPATPPGPGVDDLDATYVAKQTAMVRAEPSATARTLAKLSADDAVSVTGRIKGKDWLRVQLGSQVGYVSSSSLAEVDSSEIADWKALQAAPKLDAAQAFLQHHPNGYFKDRATALVAQLTPPPGPEVDDLNATYVAKQTSTLRAEPNNAAKPLGKLSADDGVAVTAKVKGKNWFRIKLGDQVGYIASSTVVPSSDSEIADWKALESAPKLEQAQSYLQKYPDSYFKPRVSAMVAQLTPTPPGPEIEELDATFVARQTVNVREQPSTQAPIITRLSEDDGVSVTGRVKGRDWLRVTVAGKTGYASAGLLAQADAGEIADWQALQPSPKAETVQEFLTRHPDGYFKSKASALLAALQPPEPKTAAPATQIAAAPSVTQPRVTQPPAPPQPIAPAAVTPAAPPPNAPAGNEIRVGDVYQLKGQLMRRAYNNGGTYSFDAVVTILSATGDGNFTGKVENTGFFGSIDELSVEQDGERVSIRMQTSHGAARFSLNRTSPGEYEGEATGRDEFLDVLAGPARMTRSP